MNHHLTIFIGKFTTLIAVINPLEALPVFLSLTNAQDKQASRKTAFRACLNALVLILSCLLLGTFILNIFGVNFSMV